MRNGSGNKWRAAGIPLFIGLIFAVFNLHSVLTLTVLPFTDLPNHLAEATIHKHVHDAGTQLSRFYVDETGLAKPNVAHAMICSWFSSVETGNKVLYGLYILSVPLLTMGLILMMGGDAWVGLLSILLLYNFNVVWGFVGFTLALPMLLLFLLCYGACLKRASWARLAALALSLLAVYWCHAQAFLFAMLVLVAVPLTMPPREMLRRAWGCWGVALPAVVLFLAWVARGREFEGDSNLAFLRHYYSAGYLWDLPERFAAFFWMDNARLGQTSGRTLGLLFSLPTVAAFLLYVHPGNLGVFKEDARRRVLLGFTLAAVFCYFALPDALPGQLYIYERFCVLVYLGMIGLLSLLVPVGHRRALRGLIVLMAVLYSLLWRGYFADFKRSTAGFTREFLETPKGGPAILSAVIGDADFRGAPALIHYNNYQVIWNLGATPTKAVQYRFGIVRKSTAPLADYFEWIKDDTDVDRLVSHRYAGSDYILTHGDRPRAVLLASADYELMRQAQGWSLFKSRRPGARKD